MNWLKNDKWIRMLVYTALVAAVLAAFFRFFNADELEAIHTTYKIWQGETIYVDFFQHHHPLLYYMLMPLFWILGPSLSVLFAARIILFAFFLGILFFSYRIAKHVFDRSIAWLSLLLLITTVIFIDKAIEVRPDVVQCFFSLAAVYFYFKYLSASKTKYIILGSLSLALAFLFLQKAIFIISILFIFFVYDIAKKQLPIRFALLYLSTFLAALLPFYLYIIGSGIWSDYLMFAWLINIHFIYNFPFYFWALYSAATNTVLIVFYLRGLSAMFKREQSAKLALISILLLVSVMISHLAFRQYYMLALPFISMVSAASLFKLKERNLHLYGMVVFFAFAIGLLSFAINTYYHRNSDQLELFAYTQGELGPNDYAYSSDEHVSLFHKDVDFFWFSTNDIGALATYQSLRDYSYDPYELIIEKRPRVISTYRIDPNDERISSRYHNSGVYSNIFILNDPSRQ